MTTIDVLRDLCNYLHAEREDVYQEMDSIHDPLVVVLLHARCDELYTLERVVRKIINRQYVYPDRIVTVQIDVCNYIKKRVSDIRYGVMGDVRYSSAHPQEVVAACYAADHLEGMVSNVREILSVR